MSGDELVRVSCPGSKLEPRREGEDGLLFWGVLVEREIRSVCVGVLCKMKEVGERWDIYTWGVSGWAWGFRPKPVTAQRPTRDRVAHSQPPGCESWSRVVVSALI